MLKKREIDISQNKNKKQTHQTKYQTYNAYVYSISNFILFKKVQYNLEQGSQFFSLQCIIKIDFICLL